MSVLDVVPQVSGQTKSTSLSSDNAQEADKHEEVIQAAATDETALTTQTELANYNFYCHVQQIEGVQVSIYGGDAWSERTIVVVVPDLLGDIADAVFDLKTQTHQLYPSARLDVQITESGSDNAGYEKLPTFAQP